MNADRLKLLAKDLTQSHPRSPRETLGGYVIAARTEHGQPKAILRVIR